MFYLDLTSDKILDKTASSFGGCKYSYIIVTSGGIKKLEDLIVICRHHPLHENLHFLITSHHCSFVGGNNLFIQIHQFHYEMP